MFQKENYTHEDEVDLNNNLDEQITNYCDTQDILQNSQKMEIIQVFEEENDKTIAQA